MNIDEFAQSIEERDTTFTDGEVVERLQNVLDNTTEDLEPTFSTGRGDHHRIGYDLKDPGVNVSVLNANGNAADLSVVYTYTYNEDSEPKSGTVESVMVTEYGDVASSEMYSYLVKR